MEENQVNCETFLNIDCLCVTGDVIFNYLYLLFLVNKTRHIDIITTTKSAT